jgi:lipoprotein-anchoring transpeptidase ErfK/SrfK
MKSLLLRSAALVAGVAALGLSACTTVGSSSGGNYNVVAYKPHNPDAVKVKVSLQNQAVYVMEGDRALMVAATNVGLPAKPTPRGSFRVTNKIAKKRSGSYGFWVNGNTIIPGTSGVSKGGHYVGYPMAYWVEFSPAYGFHQGFVWPVPRTHGCLRLHQNVAPKFYALVKTGTPVFIADSLPEDQSIGKNLQRPTDYNDPDPPSALLTSDRAFSPPAGPLLQ